MKRLLLATTIAAVTALTTVACAGTAEQTTTPSTSAESATGDAVTDAPGPTGVPDGMGSGAADGVFPRTVGHFGGSTEIPAEPKKIVVIATGQLDAALTLGVVPTGVAYGDGAALVPDYISFSFPQYTDQLSQVVDVGNRQSVDIEAIAAIEPDLILANKTGSEDIYPTLSTIAPTVLTEGTGVNWKQDFLLLADALGRTEQAQTFIDTFVSDAAALGNSVAGSSGTPTVSFVRFTADRARVFGVPSFAGYIAWDAGLARPESQQFDKTSQDFSEEEIQLANADWVFVSSQDAGADSSAASYTTNPLWTGMSAATENHIVRVDDDPWYLNAGPTAATIVLDGLKSALQS
ncbi:iron-siderophore ABC transporter substrate-binding protein [Rhodococcoides yunnanense]|uniref:Iron-siderophore ABC transporter substrate-binding protein n=1 Tax=Rhodococcoides yunnanense TaxID=278209 RepID=A0ABU4BG26_9NOCA|nr:iron-siderophore ABC transporter substrate-binding protein [Rhodococcus yunnanensis]MDV6263162.1 iron-siderophore ABC transporter substrate-binding protein [Rhodococcus yunnanensis]